jgi:hypothetical protein
MTKYSLSMCVDVHQGCKEEQKKHGHVVFLLTSLSLLQPVSVMFQEASAVFSHFITVEAV